MGKGSGTGRTAGLALSVEQVTSRMYQGRRILGIPLSPTSRVILSFISSSPSKRMFDITFLISPHSILMGLCYGVRGSRKSSATSPSAPSMYFHMVRLLWAPALSSITRILPYFWCRRLRNDDLFRLQALRIVKLDRFAAQNHEDMNPLLERLVYAASPSSGQYLVLGHGGVDDCARAQAEEHVSLPVEGHDLLGSLLHVPFDLLPADGVLRHGPSFSDRKARPVGQLEGSREAVPHAEDLPYAACDHAGDSHVGVEA